MKVEKRIEQHATDTTLHNETHSSLFLHRRLSFSGEITQHFPKLGHQAFWENRVHRGLRGIVATGPRLPKVQWVNLTVDSDILRSSSDKKSV